MPRPHPPFAGVAHGDAIVPANATTGARPDRLWVGLGALLVLCLLGVRAHPRSMGPTVTALCAFLEHRMGTHRAPHPPVPAAVVRGPHTPQQPLHRLSPEDVAALHASRVAPAAPPAPDAARPTTRPSGHRTRHPHAASWVLGVAVALGALARLVRRHRRPSALGTASAKGFVWGIGSRSYATARVQPEALGPLQVLHGDPRLPHGPSATLHTGGATCRSPPCPRGQAAVSLAAVTGEQLVPNVFYAVPRRRVFAVSDVHTDVSENMVWVESLCTTAYQNDVLICAGDIADDLEILERTLVAFKRRFAEVFYTPGNHELWVMQQDRDKGITCSLQKLEAIFELCAELGVHTTPQCLGSATTGRFWIVPLLSWHHKSFDTEPDIVEYDIPRPELLVRDYRLCKWPVCPLIPRNW